MSTEPQPSLLTQRQDLHFCLCFGGYTVLIFLALYALHEPVVAPFTRVIARLSYAVLQMPGARSAGSSTHPSAGTRPVPAAAG